MSSPDQTQCVLLADIGGTNARFALADLGADNPFLIESARVYRVAEFPSLADAARHYLNETGSKVRHGVFAVAGRVDGDEARITNHPWVIQVPRLRSRLELEGVRLINDFAAQAMAVSMLTSADVAQVGSAGWAPINLSKNCTYAVIGPGTGLGAGGLLVRDGKRIALDAEGGHVSFPPGNPEEIEILQRLSRHFGRVSNERLVSGPGLVNIHRALSEMVGQDPGPLQPADVTARAVEGDALCLHTLDVFFAVFGAIAGDLVLTLGAWDGVFLCGGLVPRLLPQLQRSGFRQRFENKGRFSPTMGTIPVLANLHPQAGLLGAAATAVEVFGTAHPARARLASP